MKLKIWQRYFLKELIKIFFLFIIVFYFLYSIIDYSMNIKKFLGNSQIGLFDIVRFYSFSFLKRAEIIIPLALLVSILKVLLSLNAHRELVALQVAGLSFKKLMRPFFWTGSICTLFLLINFQWLSPPALAFLDEYEQTTIRSHRKSDKVAPLCTLTLKDGSHLIYQTFDKQNHRLEDVIWVKSHNDLYRMKYLSANPELPIGYFVDHIERNKEDALEKTHSFNAFHFQDLKWSPTNFRKGHVPIDNFSISQLWKLKNKNTSFEAYKKPEISTHLLYKTLLPLLSLLVVIGITPYCTLYCRNTPTFILYCGSMFGLITFFTIIDGAVILGENGVISPLIAIGLPFSLAIVIFTRKFRKRAKT